MKSPENNIYHDLPVQEGLERVFQVISEPTELTQWWPLKCSGTPGMGELYNFFFGEPYNWFGKVVQFQKNESFYIQMTDADEDWNGTIFGFELAEAKGTTWIKFSHKGWSAPNQHFRHSSFCWALLLNGLKQYIEKGVVIPFEDRS